jgi:GTPase SAR1 family protein
MLDILNLQPNKVSRDMRGYSVLMYGTPKSGKTTTASKFPNALLVAFEKGYSAIPNVLAAPVNSWNEFRQLLKQLEKPEAKAKYSTIVVDTADIAYDYCVKYICAKASDAKK